MNGIKFYKTEKNTNIIFLASWIVLMLAITISLSFLYSLLSKIMPIIYFCIIITIGFGLSISFLARFSSKIFQITNKKQLIYGTIIFSIVGVYASWVAYINDLDGAYYSTSSFGSYISNFYLWFSPLLIFNTMKNISAVGLWEIMGGLVNGATLWVIWLIEALLIIGASLYAVIPYQIAPFSTRSNKWYKKVILNKQFTSIVNTDKTMIELAKNPEGIIEAMVNGEINRHAIITIHFLEEESRQYLKIDNVRYDREGKLIYSKTEVDNLEISTQSAKNIIKKFHGKKEIFFD